MNDTKSVSARATASERAATAERDATRPDAAAERDATRPDAAAERGTTLPAAAVSAFCEGLALMLGAGIQLDEAVHMLGEHLEDASFRRVCRELYPPLAAGEPLERAIRRVGAFPAHAEKMIAVGERSGRLEDVLGNLAAYYDEEDRVFAKVRAAVGYPAALLAVMSVILAFTVWVILPVFIDVYEGLAGSLTAGSSAVVGVAVVLGWIALVLTIVLTVAALAAFATSRTPAGQERLVRFFERMPLTRRAMYQLALSRFSAALAAYTAAGLDDDAAMREALATVDHDELRQRLEQAQRAMTDLNRGRSLAQAITEAEVFEPVYARMLAVGTRVGRIDNVLARLAGTFFDDALAQIDRVVNSIEPALAAFLTVAVGATLIAIMLPLVGIMGSIG